ncbi:hypothetical protein Asppvi_010870 [Aspergillus pseudoviridinutans]|uniref:Uncharacterized protein n=1 Tax=Aspergillus pseudoviridinutans TaxID=1517512 RepID=A0A9P3BIH3_9EURO|nr:uncharacterized protein Asppvi_010870 [Aspergillus pseudoviridinutans]GIJ91895.1 hypothetical protein Asppvi_010870 [Aspergillus pseudoviridinutans]
MAELTCEQARQIVDEISQRNGIITDEDRAATPPAVIKALQSVRNQLGSRRHPWTPCDTPDVRRDVVFQLISSARSLHYNWAKKQGKEPYFALDVSPDRMIIDTNDDGCLKSDIVRLSEGGAPFLQNARTSNLYDTILPYTFRIARTAHIQSGPFSFALAPQSLDDRLGFTTPVNKDPASLPGGVRTRIILYPALPKGFDKLVNEFKDIANNGFVLVDPDDTRQPVCKKFVFIVSLENFQITGLTYEFQVRDGILEVTKTYPGLFNSLQSFTERFLLYKPTISSLLFDKMALLFPIDQNSRPAIRSRKAYHIVGSFAFPIRGEEFSFVVCVTVTKFVPVRDADIDTSALLKDCVINSFCGAVSFCQNHSLFYEWVQYIPKQSSASPAWHKTVQVLIENLRVAPVFQSQNGVLKSLSSLRYLSPGHYGADNEPLFGSWDDEHYLSTKYSAYLDLLKPLGLQEISDHELLERLKPVLTKPLRVLPSSNLWKERVSLVLRLLIAWLKSDPNNTLATEIRNIPLIELSNGSFVRGNDLNLTRSEADLAFANDAVYFPKDTNGNDIPQCLDILTVSEEAIRDNDQKELFCLLGVRHASPELVMRLISDHSHSTSRVLTTVMNLIADFVHILCYVYESCAKDDHLKTPCLMIFDEQRLRRLVCGNSCPRYIPSDVYFRTDGAYGTEAIAKTLDSESLLSPRILLLHPAFLYPNNISKTHIADDAWRIWLEQQRIIRRVPRLTHWNNRKQLSEIFNTIISHHPDILLGILGRYWDTYGIEIRGEPLIASAIKGAKVPTSNGLARLDECYFPIPEFCNLVEAMSTTLNINFLKLPGIWGPDSEQERGFLRELGVSSGGAATFIKVVKDRLLSTMTTEDAKPHFFELYRWISERLFDDDPCCSDVHWGFFDDERTVYIPNSGDGAKLVCLDQCVWHGPLWLRTAHALAFHEEYASDSKIRRLFLDTLDVKDADWGTYMTELLHLQDVGVGLLEETQRIYQAIVEDIEDGEDWNSLRNQFHLSKMIYVPGSKRWYAPQQCIWALFSTADKMGISGVYPGMESFFVERLRVRPPSIHSYISRIQLLREEKGSDTEVIEALCYINNLKPTMSDLNCLKLIDFLPIEGVEKRFYWGSVTSDFFIIDRDGWPMLFYGKVPTVQFSLTKVRQLAPLLKSLGLENRFISICAARETSISKFPSQSSEHLTTDFSQRSSYLSRCVAHFNGGNVNAARELYETFRKAVVYETAHIVGKCTLTSLSGSSTSLETYSRLHMEYLNGKLSIFVPPDENERLICYATQLPESLITSLEIKDPAAHGIFATVLVVAFGTVDGILKTHGIPEVSDLDPVSLVTIDDSESVYEDALEEVFVPRASIAWGGKDQLLASEQSELQLVLRPKDMHITEYRPHSDRQEMMVKEDADG